MLQTLTILSWNLVVSHGGKKKKAFPFAVCIWLNSREPKWLFLAVWSNYIFTFEEEDLPTSCGHARSSLEGFLGGSEGKESACNVEDLGSIPGLGRSTGEGKGYPLQDLWASFVSQLVKNPPAMWETWVWTLGWEDPQEKGKATHSCILASRIPWTV